MNIDIVLMDSDDETLWGQLISWLCNFKTVYLINDPSLVILDPEWDDELFVRMESVAIDLFVAPDFSREPPGELSLKLEAL